MPDASVTCEYLGEPLVAAAAVSYRLTVAPFDSAPDGPLDTATEIVVLLAVLLVFLQENAVAAIAKSINRGNFFICCK